MSLLVGILCQNGVVIASDSSRASGADGPATIEQPLEKTRVVARDLIFAATGQVGLGQRLEPTLRELREDSRFPEWQHMAIARSISAEAMRDFTATGSDLRGFGALVAFRCATGFHLCEFTVGGLQPEFKRPELWFASMGRARATAESLLGLVRRTLLADRRPSLEEGIFAAAWSLGHAIELRPGRVQGPPQIAVLADDPADPLRPARLLSEAEVADQLGKVRRVEEHLGQIRRLLSKES